jgi:hypothetical protein
MTSRFHNGNSPNGQRFPAQCLPVLTESNAQPILGLPLGYEKAAGKYSLGCPTKNALQSFRNGCDPDIAVRTAYCGDVFRAELDNSCRRMACQYRLPRLGRWLRTSRDWSAYVALARQIELVPQLYVRRWGGCDTRLSRTARDRSPSTSPNHALSTDVT